MSNILYIQEIIAELDGVPQTKLTVHSTSLQSLSTSIKEPEEMFNKVDLPAICEAFDNFSMNAVHWCPGINLLGDPPTKDNKCTATLLLAALASGKHERPSEMVTNLGPTP